MATTNRPPVMKMTFSDRSGMSLAGLNGIIGVSVSVAAYGEVCGLMEENKDISNLTI